MKKIWTGITSIISQKSFAHSSIDVIQDVFGKSVTDPAQMSYIFNEYFLVSDNINKTIPRTPNSPLRYLDSAIENSLFLSPVSHLEIEDLIVNLNSSKSIGPHSVPINILKIVECHISHPLAEIINQSFLKGTFPSKLEWQK